MRVAYLGNFRPAHSTENHVRLSLESLGHEVLPIQEDAVCGADVVARVAAARPALLLWTRTWTLEGAEEMFQGLRRLGVLSVGYHLDVFAGLERASQVDVNPWFRCDHVFTADGGSEEFWSAKGVRHHWMQPGVLEAECYTAEPVAEQEVDVLFVGARGYHQEWPLRVQLLDWLKARYGKRFAHYDHSSGMRGDRLNRLYASAKVVVGDSCFAGRRARYWSDRIPETLGRGGFLVHPWVEGLAEHYPPTLLPTFEAGDFETLDALIDFYLERPDLRESMRRRAHQHVREHHTYRHRMQAMLATVGL